jgi:hypothetical protein
MTFGENAFHIVAGEGMGRVVRDEFGIPPARILVDTDILCCGPLMALADPEQWDRLRNAYWATVDPLDSRGQSLLEQMVANFDRLEAASSIHLWLGPALAESLVTGFVLGAFDLMGLDASRLKVIDLEPVFDAVGDRFPIDALRGDMLRVAGPWQEMDKASQACYRQIWRAATAPTPELLIAFSQCDTPWPAPLKEGIRSWLAWYPSAKSGLGFWDEMLLNNSSTSPITAARTIEGCLRHAVGLGCMPGDAWLFHRIRRMADPGLAWPLLEMTGDGQTYRHSLTRLTDAGIDILNGDDNAIVLNGIEDRIGGVRLGLDQDRLWFYDGDSLTTRARMV